MYAFTLHVYQYMYLRTTCRLHVCDVQCMVQNRFLFLLNQNKFVTLIIMTYIGMFVEYFEDMRTKNEHYRNTSEPMIVMLRIEAWSFECKLSKCNIILLSFWEQREKTCFEFMYTARINLFTFYLIIAIIILCLFTLRFTVCCTTWGLSLCDCRSTEPQQRQWMQ